MQAVAEGGVNPVVLEGGQKFGLAGKALHRRTAEIAVEKSLVAAAAHHAHTPPGKVWHIGLVEGACLLHRKAAAGAEIGPRHGGALQCRTIKLKPGDDGVPILGQKRRQKIGKGPRFHLAAEVLAGAGGQRQVDGNPRQFSSGIDKAEGRKILIGEQPYGRALHRRWSRKARIHVAEIGKSAESFGGLRNGRLTMHREIHPRDYCQSCNYQFQ